MLKHTDDQRFKHNQRDWPCHFAAGSGGKDVHHNRSEGARLIDASNESKICDAKHYIRADNPTGDLKNIYRNETKT
jgi:hypothetical protein